MKNIQYSMHFCGGWILESASFLKVRRKKFHFYLVSRKWLVVLEMVDLHLWSLFLPTLLLSISGRSFYIKQDLA